MHSWKESQQFTNDQKLKDYISKLEKKIETLVSHEQKFIKCKDTVEKLVEKFSKEKEIQRKQLEDQFKSMKAEIIEKYELEISTLKRLNEKLYLRAETNEKLQETVR